MWQKRGIFTLLLVLALVIIAFYICVLKNFFMAWQFTKSVEYTVADSKENAGQFTESIEYTVADSKENAGQFTESIEYTVADSKENAGQFTESVEYTVADSKENAGQFTKSVEYTVLDCRENVNKNLCLLEWICIPPALKNINICRPPQTELISFSANSNRSMEIKGQNVRITTSLSKNYTLLNDTVAIFHGYTKSPFPNNLFHYVTQYYIPFHYLLDFSSSLSITKAMKKTIFFSKPLKDKCIYHNFSSFFLGSLNVIDSGKYAYTHHAHPGGVCYRYGIFSDQLFSEHTDKATAHLHSFYGVKTQLCPKNQIILSKRSNTRFWTNIDDLYKAAIAAGFTNTSVVDFGKISLEAQLRLVYCTDVLVSPQAAALEWSHFMKPNSTVVEIAWPKYGWGFFYSRNSSRWYGHPPLQYIQLSKK